jgi:hypothetical protein
LLSLSLVLSPGNYVVQQVFVCGGEDHKAAILEMLTRDDSLLKFSKHKYASNVVETVLMHGQAHHKEIIMQEILKVSQSVPISLCLPTMNAMTLICSLSVFFRTREVKTEVIAV